VDTRTGDIYDSREAALAAGVPDEHIVTGERAALEQMAEAIRSKRGGWMAPNRNRVVADRRATRAMQTASRKRNR